MPSATELTDWIDRRETDLEREYAQALAAEAGDLLIFGPSYSRAAWEYFVDAVRCFRIADHEAREVWEASFFRTINRARARALPLAGDLMG